jgi:quinol monooxygenase YgiN
LTAQVGLRNNSAKHEGQIEGLWGSKRTARHINTVLVEVYRTPDEPAKHKEIAHYAKWRDTVAEMMAEPRSSVKYDNIFPDDAGWG